MMRLSHPNIIKIFQIMDSEEECYVVMELAKGGELMDYITARGKLSEKESRRYFRQIVSAMAHIHSANIVHRDLKLENILISEENECLISDFGLGRTWDGGENTKLKTFCGTPNYASIELVTGTPYTGTKSDIWAMGVILYVMTAGKRPFKGSNAQLLYKKIMTLDYEIPIHFSDELEDLIQSIFVKDPTKRIDMEGIRNHPWLNIDYPEPPPFSPAKIVADDALLAKTISSVHNVGVFTIYTISNHSPYLNHQNFDSQRASTDMPIVHRTRRVSSISTATYNDSSHFQEAAVPIDPSKSVGPSIRRNSLQDARSFTVSRTPPLMDNLIKKYSKTTSEYTMGKEGPSSFSNELCRRRSSMSSDNSMTKNRPESVQPQSSYSRRRSFTGPVRVVDENSETNVEPSLLEDSTAVSVGLKQASYDTARPRIKQPAIGLEHSIMEETSICQPHEKADERNVLNNEKRVRRNRAPSASSIQNSYIPGLENSIRSRRSSQDQAALKTTEAVLESLRNESRRGSTQALASASGPNSSTKSGYDLVEKTTIEKKHLARSLNELEKTGEIRRRSNTVSGSSHTTRNGKGSNEEKLWDHTSVLESHTSSAKAISDEPSPQQIESWHQIHRPPKALRNMRFPFSKKTYSSHLEAPKMFQDIHQILMSVVDNMTHLFNLKFVRNPDHYLFLCSTEYIDSSIVKFEVEVCKIWLLKMHGIRIKRLSGDGMNFKAINDMIIQGLGYNG
jgi:serine/threonine protein kinase